MTGDCNCDGAVSTDDEGYFTAAQGGETSWRQYYRDRHNGQNPPCPYLNADTDGDSDGDQDDSITAYLTGPAKDGRVFVYDEENRLTSVTRPDGTPLLEIARRASVGLASGGTGYGSVP